MIIILPLDTLAIRTPFTTGPTTRGQAIGTEGEQVPVRIDAAFLANMPFMLNLVTDFGIIVLTFKPSGPLDGVQGWNSEASSEEVADGLFIRVALLDDIIASKRSAN